jgi:hypothetical protein
MAAIAVPRKISGRRSSCRISGELPPAGTASDGVSAWSGERIAMNIGAGKLDR